MIFVTVGGQLPFDRLVRAVDEWAGRVGRGDVVAQIGESQLKPRNLRAISFLSRQEFQQHLQEATGIVAHAGIGTILASLELGKPLLVLPRLQRLGEQRSDHQVATARHFSEAGLVLSAFTDKELSEKLDELDSCPEPSSISSTAQPELLARIRAFALGEPKSRC